MNYIYKNSLVWSTHLIALTFICLVSTCTIDDTAPTTSKLFKSLPSNETGVYFANQLNETEKFNIIKYLYYYNGGGVAVGDINNDDLPDIFFTANQAPNKMYLNKGEMQFEDITTKAGVAGLEDVQGQSWTTGVTMADVNADGWLDIYVCQVGDFRKIKGANELWINNQDGTFTESATKYGLNFIGFSQQAAFFDYDLDGDLDMYLLNHSVHSTSNFRNAKGRETLSYNSGDRLYRNDDGFYNNVTEESGIYSSKIGYGLGIGVDDMNDDGYPDIYIANDFHENDYLYFNNGDGTFSENINDATGHTSTFSMGCDVADLNNDAQPDIMTLDMKPFDERVYRGTINVDPYNVYLSKLKAGYHYQSPRNSLQINQGTDGANQVKFSEIGQYAGVDATDWSWSTLMADLDLDGWKDIYITNGIYRRPNDLEYLNFISDEEIQESASDLDLAARMPLGEVNNFAYRNNRALRFEEVSQEWGLDLVGCSNGAAYGDLDNDGDLDLVVNNLNIAASIYENQAVQQGKNFVKVEIKGDSKNPFGYGTKVTLNGQTQTLQPSRGWQSAVDGTLVFGIADSSKINITYQLGQSKGQVSNAQLNSTVTIDLTKATLKPTQSLSQASPKAPIQALLGSTGFTHKENSFNDFNIEKLLLEKQSTLGPKIAIGDVNSDGLDDFYIGGAKAQAGQLFLQSSDGFATKGNSFETDKMFEDIDATFFDADGDGDLDLYVVSGGGEARDGDDRLLDRYYVNDGTGNFEQQTFLIEEVKTNGSTVVAADFNQDGFLDLFVGSGGLAGSYGAVGNSKLLIGNGKGRFKDFIGKFAPALEKVGMVRDAAWNAATKELVIVGHWMPVTIANFSSGKAVVRSLPNSNGWWNDLALADINQDGDLDILVGNMGQNTHLKASSEMPLELYVKDFDNNLSIDPILAYYQDGQKWTFATKKDLTEQLTILRKVFPDFELYANSPFENVFPAPFIKDLKPFTINTLASTAWLSDGQSNYIAQELPSEAQWSSVFAMNFDGQSLLTAGNFKGYTPAIGNADASYGFSFRFDNEKFQLDQGTNWNLKGEIRDIKRIGKYTLIARNNDSLLIYED